MLRLAFVLSPFLFCLSAIKQVSAQLASRDALVNCLVWLVFIPAVLPNAFGQTVSTTGTQTLSSSSATQASNVLATAQAKLNPGGVLPALKITGQITKTEPPGVSQLTLYIADESHYRSEVVTNGSLYIYAINDWIGWYDDNGKRKGLPLHMTYGQRCPFVPAYTLLADQASPNFRIKQLSQRGNSSVVDVAFAHNTDPDFDNITRTSLVFDPVTGLLAELDSLLLAPFSYATTSQIKYFYSDYKPEQGLLLPHTIMIQPDGGSTSVVTLNTFELWTVDPSIF